MIAAILQVAVHVTDTMKRSNASMVVRADYGRIGIAAAFFSAEKLSKNVLPVKKSEEKGFLRHAVKNNGDTMKSLVA